MKYLDRPRGQNISRAVLTVACLGCAILGVSGYAMPVAEAQPRGRLGETAGEMRGGRGGGPACMIPMRQLDLSSMQRTVMAVPHGTGSAAVGSTWVLQHRPKCTHTVILRFKAARRVLTPIWTGIIWEDWTAL